MRVRERLLLTLLILSAAAAQAQYQFRVLHAFGVVRPFASRTDGAGLWGSLALDDQGNLYGTTSGGGTYNNGTIFELSPQPSGEWTESILYNFCSTPPDCMDGSGPVGGPILDAAGNIFGTTVEGGGPYRYGTVYELMPNAGVWTEAVLYSFDFSHGCCPQSALVVGNGGNLYGIAGGPLFQLSRGADGSWTEAVLHDFTGQNGDGDGPQAGPIVDSAGNLYGTTVGGGAYNAGTVYEVQPVRTNVGGTWKERILFSFGGYQGDGIWPPIGQLAMDSAGNLYGTTNKGGAYGEGTVFKLSRVPGAATWKETILHSFNQAMLGLLPSGGVTLDAAGNLYGTTITGGVTGCGVIYKMTRASPTPNGPWQYTVLHQLAGFDGCEPDANLTVGPDGSIYGTTATAGAGGYGTVFQIQITQ